MAIIANDIDTFLQGETVRIGDATTNFITLTSTAPLFKKTSAGLVPTTISITANLSGVLNGTVVFSVETGTGTLTPTGNTVVLSGTVSTTEVIKATLTFLGKVYESRITIATIDDVVTHSISKSSISVVAEADGSSPVLTQATNTVSVLVGLVVDTVNWAHSWSVVSGTATLSGAGTSTVTIATLTTDEATIRVTSTKAGYPNFTKDFIVTKAKKGTNATTPIVADLTNQAHVVFTNNDGTGASYVGAGGTCKVFQGTSDVTTSSTFSIVGGTTTKTQNGLTITIGAATGIYTLSGTWTTDTETFTIQAIYSGTTLTQVYTISKSKTGAAGAAGAYAFVDAGVSAISKASSSSAISAGYTPASITVRGKRGTGTGVPVNYGYASYRPNEGSESTRTLSSTGITYTPAATGVTYVTVYMYDTDATTLLDQEDIPIVFMGTNGTNGTTPANGIDGTKVGSALCYIWAASTPALPNAAFTYYWSSNTPGSYPAGWSASPTTNTNVGWVLYRLEVRPSDTALAISTSGLNWNTGSLGSFGYTAQGTIGLLGGSARRAYLISTSSTPPSVAASTYGDSLPSGWSANPTTPTAGQFLYQVDGTYNTSGNTTSWVTQSYLSNLKVGSLSAITANMGILNVDSTLTVGSTGSIFSSGKGSYNSTTAGFFLGYDSGYKFNIGDSSNYLKWTGSALDIKGSITGGTININNAFTVNTAGVVSVSSLLGLNSINYVSIYSNAAYSGHSALQGVIKATENTYWGIGVYGSVSSASNYSSAQGVLGANYKAASQTIGILGSGNGYDVYASGAAANYGPFTGSHDGLIDPSTVPYLTVGDILLDIRCIHKKNIHNTLFLVGVTTLPKQKGVVGVLSEIGPLVKDDYVAALIEKIEDVHTTDREGNPVTISNEIKVNNYGIISNQYNTLIMNSLGEGQVNVCGENGDLEPGDLITSSSMYGKGMKQGDDIVRGHTVAKCREYVQFSHPEEVKMVACIYLCG